MSGLFLIEAEKREKTGKTSARALRKDGRIPATIYGKTRKPVSIAVDKKLITTRYLKGRFRTQLCEIKINDKETIQAFPKEICLHPVTDQIRHVDFYGLDKGQKIHLKIPVRFINEAKCIGIKRGGAVNISMREVELICDPQNVPSELVVDLQNLVIGQSVHQSALELPKGSELPAKNASLTVLAITGRGSDDDNKGDDSDDKAADAK